MNRLNNLFPDDESYDTLHSDTYLKNGKLPEHLIRSKFIQKYKDFKLRDNKISIMISRLLKKAMFKIN